MVNSVMIALFQLNLDGQNCKSLFCNWENCVITIIIQSNQIGFYFAFTQLTNINNLFIIGSTIRYKKLTAAIEG